MTKTRWAALLAFFSLLAFSAAADGPVLRLKEDQAEAWKKAREDCGALKDDLCRKRFWEILTPEQRSFHAMDEQYDENGRKKPDPSKSTTEFRLSARQVGEWGQIAKTCGDPQGAECKRQFKAMLTPPQRAFLGIAD